MALTPPNAGINSAGHQHTAWMAEHAGIRVNHIPYKGAAETTQALLLGQVHQRTRPFVGPAPAARNAPFAE